jgi:hypothetical protein
MLGDFNLVEQAIDRLPMHNDRENTVEALAKIKDKLSLMDGWRETYPTTKDYTFVQGSTNSRSRIDHIYINKQAFADAQEWQISLVGIPTDHMLASVRITHPENPDLGPGRWSMKNSSIKNQKAAQFAREEGIKLAEEFAQLQLVGRTEEKNPQVSWCTYKKRLADRMKKLDQQERCILDRKITQVQKELKETQNSESIPEDER